MEIGNSHGNVEYFWYGPSLGQGQTIITKRKKETSEDVFTDYIGRIVTQTMILNFSAVAYGHKHLRQ